MRYNIGEMIQLKWEVSAGQGLRKEIHMGNPEKAAGRREKARRSCKVCGKPSGSVICEECSMRIQIEALIRKHHEEDGNAWSHWK